MSQPLSSNCRVYVVGVGAAGMLPIAWALWALVHDPPHVGWYLLAGLAVLSGPLCIRVPTMQATISVSEGFIFTAALLFGPAAATIVAAIDGLAVAVWSSHRTAVRTLFGIAEPAISVCGASLLFYGLTGVPPLLHHPTAFAPLLLPLLAMTATYFTLNTMMAGMALSLDSGQRLLALFRQHLPHVALGFSVTVMLTSALVQMSGNLTLAVVVVFAPMLAIAYISSQQVVGRLEDANRHLSELRRLYDSTVETLAMAIDAKDQVTHGHIRRVQVLSTRLARTLGAADRDVQALAAAALLHDLGKLAVPEHILNKPGPLTAAEYDEMKKHADVGASILSAIDFPYPVVPIVRHHHESWDGTGYPDGLRGAAIPLGARVLAVVDCYDALTSDRPYRRRMTQDEAMSIIQERSGGMYDPAVVDAFATIDLATESESTGATSDLVHLPRRALRETEAAIVPRVVPARPKRDDRERAQRFLATVEGESWHDAGQRIAAFFAASQPDSVAALFRYDAGTHELIFAGTHHAFDPRVPETILLGQGVTGWVGANKQKILNADAELDLGDVASMIQPPLRLCVSVPLVSGPELQGVLTVYSPYAFGETHRMSIEAVAEGLVPALHRPGATNEKTATREELTPTRAAL